MITNFKNFENINENLNSNENNSLKFDENEIIKTSNNEILVGFWKYGEKKYYGLPELNWIGWNDSELYKDFILKYKYLIRNAHTNNYRGWSFCRICHERNGSSEYIINNKYIVPKGYLHYIIEHKIKPHKWFLDYVLKQEINIL